MYSSNNSAEYIASLELVRSNSASGHGVLEISDHHAKSKMEKLGHATTTGRAGKKAVRKGWNPEMIRNANSSAKELDWSKFTNRKGASVYYGVLHYPGASRPGPKQGAKDITTLTDFMKPLLGDAYAAVISKNFKRSGQLHIDFVSVLTPAEVVAIQTKWSAITGFASGTALNSAAHFKTLSPRERFARSKRAQIEQVLNYIFPVSEAKQKEKAHQFKTPQEWLDGEESIGDMRGTYGLKKAPVEEIEIVGHVHRAAIDAYLRRTRRRSYRVATERATGEMILIDVAPWGTGRKYGSSIHQTISSRMKADLLHLAEKFSGVYGRTVEHFEDLLANAESYAMNLAGGTR